MKLTAKVLAPILAVSISQLIHAVPFNANVQNGNWSDPNSWDLVLVPDTYLGDTANILGFTIDYDSGTTLLGGGLGIANGGSLTIDGVGSILTQTVTTEAIQIGEGSGGAGTGTGTLTIQNGGAMNTGLATGMAVGSGGVDGDGHLDIFGGTLTLGSGATGTGFGVGVGGATGVVTVGNGSGASSINLAANNVQMGVGVLGSGTGTVNIGSDGTISFGTGGITIGQGGGTGTLAMVAGAQLLGGSGAIIVGDTTAGTNGALSMSGGTITTAGEIRINAVGAGAVLFGFDMAAGSTVTTTGDFRTGSGASAIGTARQAGGVLSVNNFYVGSGGGMGTYTISSGSITDTNEIAVGLNSGSNGTLNITGATVTGSTALSQATVDGEGANRAVRAGVNGGVGNINITAGGILNTTNEWFALGQDNGASGTATVSGTGSTLNTHGAIVGWSGLSTGTLNITNNGVVNNSVHEFSIGRDNGGANSPTGIVNINTGGTLNAGVDLRIGHNAAGTVNLSGGTVNSGTGWAIVGDGGTSVGTVNMTAGNFNVSDTFFIANNPGAQGTFNQSGGTTTITNELNLARDRSTGVLNVSGGVFSVGGWTTIGRDNNGNVGGSGTINVSNGGEYRHQTGNNGDFLLGWKDGSTGAVNVSTGGTVNYSWWTRVAVDQGSTGSITVDGATSNWNNTGGRVFIGESGSGTLTITNGGHFTMTNADWFVAGGNDGANSKGNGIVTISGAGSLLTSNNFLAFGRGRQNASNLATGTLNMTSGTISSTGSWIGFGTDQGTGTANISGTATGTSAGETITGRGVNSIGTFNLSGSAVWNSGGEFQVGNDGGVGVANISSGTLNLLSYMAIGRNTNGNGGLNGGNGTVNLSGTGVINKVNNNGTFDIGSWNGGNNGTTNTSGTLNQTGGTINNTVSNTYVGRDSGVVGVWNMSGGIANLHDLNVGNGGNGTLAVSGTGSISTGNGWMRVGTGGGSVGVVNQSGGSINNSTGGWLLISSDGDGSVGTINQSGGTFSTSRLFIGARGGSNRNGTLNITGGTFNDDGAGGQTHIGQGNATDTGTLNVSGTGVATFTGNQDIQVGQDGGHGFLNVTGGGQLTTNWWVNVARGGGGTQGTVLVDGAGSVLDQTANGDFNVGEDGTGTLTASNGGWVKARYMVVSRNGGSTGTLNVTTGGKVSSNSNIVVGNGANGTMNVASGGIVTTNNELIIGANPGITGTMFLTGGTVSPGGEWQVGNNGGTGVANISGGTLDALGYVAIGRNTNNNGGANGGNGTVNLSGTGVLQKVTGGGSFDVGSWNGGNNATTNTSGTLNQTGGAVLIGNNTNTYVGRDSGVSGNWNITGGNVSATVGDFRIHNSGGAANDVMSVGGSGAFSLTAANNSYVGGGGASTGSGTLNITNPNASFTFNSEFWVGNDGSVGTMNMSAGSITANSWFDLGRNSATGVLNLSGGTITKLTGTGQVNIGSSGTGQGTLNQSGGTLTNTAVDTLIARDPSTVGAWNMTAGTASLARLNIGNSGIGTLSMTGGIITASDRVSIATNGGSTGTANLNGGVVKTQFVEAGAGAVTLNMGGGTLRAYADEVDFLRNITVNLVAGGGTIDTDGHNVTLNTTSTISGGVGIALTHIGNGNLDIKDTQSYDILNANGGLTTLDSALGTGTSTLNANANVQVNIDQTLGSLNIGNGAEVTFGDVLPFAPEPPKAVAPFGGGNAGLVPEPGSIGLLLVGALGILARRRRTN